MRKQQQSVKPRKQRRSPVRYRLEQPLKLEEQYRAIVRSGLYSGQLLCRTPNDYLRSLLVAPGTDAKTMRMCAELLEVRCVQRRQPELQQRRHVAGHLDP
jgi:hypothetical protein